LNKFSSQFVTSRRLPQKKLLIVKIDKEKIKMEKEKKLEEEKKLIQKHEILILEINKAENKILNENVKLFDKNYKTNTEFRK